MNLNFFKVKTCFVKKYNSKIILKTKITSFDSYHMNSYLLHYQFATTGFSPEKKNFENTVKPVLTTTSEQRPPVNNDQPQSGPAKISSKFASE
jgi:hypothetical protein